MTNKNTDLKTALESLLEGVNPITKQTLSNDSIATTKEGSKVILALISELSVKPKTTKTQPRTPEERREDNLKKGKPANAGFKWTSEELKKLNSLFCTADDIPSLAETFERTPLAIALKLSKDKLITEEELDLYR